MTSLYSTHIELILDKEIGVDHPQSTQESQMDQAGGVLHLFFTNNVGDGASEIWFPSGANSVQAVLQVKACIRDTQRPNASKQKAFLNCFYPEAVEGKLEDSKKCRTFWRDQRS